MPKKHPPNSGCFFAHPRIVPLEQLRIRIVKTVDETLTKEKIMDLIVPSDIT